MTDPTDEFGSTRGRLLVAAPGLLDPNFARTVLLMIEHTSEGALGVVLNRPSETPVSDVIERWGPFVSEPGVFYAGGPVATDGFIALAEPAEGRSRAVDDASGWVPIFDGLFSVDLSGTPADAPPIEYLRVYSGHAGWAPGQLDDELTAGGWIVVDRVREDVFTRNPADLWRDVLVRQPGRLAWFADAPTDPSTN